MNIKLNETEKIRLEGTDDVYAIMQKILQRENKIDLDREHFWTICLNEANKILNIELISMGSIRKTTVEPMEVFSVPLQKRAVKIILVHNDPSGALQPSEADKDITDLLLQGAKLLQLEVLDHLMISTDSYYSYKKTGLLADIAASLKYVPVYEIKRRFQSMGEEIGMVKGEIKGIKEGEKIGEKNKAVEMAKVMLSDKLALEMIAKFTGLSVPEIEAIKL